MQRIQELARDAHYHARWLLIMLAACGGCKTPMVHDLKETSLACCDKTCCDSQHAAGDACVTCCEPACYGYEPTCWSRWPVGCPSRCLIGGEVPVDPPVFLLQETITDSVYEEGPAWQPPSTDVDAAPSPLPFSDERVPEAPLPVEFRLHAPEPSTPVTQPVTSTESHNESSPPKRVPPVEESLDLSLMIPTNAPWLTDEQVRTLSDSMLAIPNRGIEPAKTAGQYSSRRHNQGIPRVAGLTFDAATTKAGEAGTQVSSRRGAKVAQRSPATAVVQTAAVATPEALSRRGLVRTAEMEIAATQTSPRRISRPPINPWSTFPQPEPGTAMRPSVVPIPTAAEQDPNLANKVDASPRFDIQRLPKVNDLNAVSGVDHRTIAKSDKKPAQLNVAPLPNARRVSRGDGTIHFAKDKTRTPAGFEAAGGTSSTVRFR